MKAKRNECEGHMPCESPYQETPESVSAASKSQEKMVGSRGSWAQGSTLGHENVPELEW